MPCLAPSAGTGPTVAAFLMVEGRARHGARHSVGEGWASDGGVGGPPCRVWHRALAPAPPLLPSSWWMDEPGTEPDTPWSLSVAPRSEAQPHATESPALERR